MNWRNRIVGHGEEAPDQLLAHPLNHRLHPKAQQQALAGVLSEIGWVQDVVVNQRSGHVLDGHLRVELAISRDEPTVPVVYVDLSEDEETLVLSTFDAITTRAATDKEKLATLTEQARAVATNADVRALLEQLAKEAGARGLNGSSSEEPADLASQGEALRQQWGVEAGQLWDVPSRKASQHSHRILCGDALDAADLARLVAQRSVDALISDPPYGCGLLPAKGRLGSHSSRAGIPGTLYEPVAGDDRPFDPSPFLSYPIAVLWGANWYCSRLPDTSCWLVWNKRDGTASNDMADAELAWTNLQGPTRLFSHRWMGMIRDSERGETRLHPTQKPVALFEWVIEQCRLPHGATILDPFAGSGASLLAAERTGRATLAMEIVPAYVAVMLQRCRDAGLEPRRIAEAA